MGAETQHARNCNIKWLRLTVAFLGENEKVRVKGLRVSRLRRLSTCPKDALQMCDLLIGTCRDRVSNINIRA